MTKTTEPTSNILAPAVISRSEAKSKGLKHYFTGKACVRGHIDERFTSIGKCKACTREDAMRNYVHKTSRRRAYSDLFSFVEVAEDIHLGKYSYLESEYKGAHTKIRILCHRHGPFYQTPTNHIQGKGCPSCNNELIGERSRNTTDDFILAARSIWGDMFDYRKVDYKAASRHVTIICPDHGEFEQTPNNHIHNKRNGCTKCNHMKSSGEGEVHKFLSIFTSAEQRNRTLIKPKEVDIHLPDVNIGIEYCGMYWHSHGDAEDEKTNKLKHFEKYKLCAEQGVRLITIYESEWLENSKVIKRLLRNAIGKSRGKVMARKCELREVAIKEAKAFYEKYHPQGGSGNGDHYGLYWKEKLVACMRFTLGGNDRGCGAKNRQWTLSRYATRITVTGGASRLFKAFIKKEQPSSVKSFSDNRYFGGGMYSQLGFKLDEEVGPDYQVWSQKIGLRPKPHYQRRVIQKRLDEHGVDEEFDHNSDPRTEKEMTYLMGARRIYDCGKKRWIWTP